MPANEALGAEPQLSRPGAKGLSSERCSLAWGGLAGDKARRGRLIGTSKGCGIKLAEGDPLTPTGKGQY